MIKDETCGIQLTFPILRIGVPEGEEKMQQKQFLKIE